MGLFSAIKDIFGGGDAPDPPDYGPLAQASEKNLELMLDFYREQLDFAKQAYAENKERLNRVLEIQLPVMEEQYKNFLEDRQRYEELYQPVEDQLIQEASTYDSPEQIQAEQGRVLADLNKSFDAQRNAALQKLESYGVDPTQTRYAALDRMARVGQAAASAQALNQAKLQRENVGRALRGEVVNIGKGYPGQVASAAGQAVNAGSSAMGNANSTAQVATQMRSSALPGLQGANAAVGQWNNVVNNSFQNRLASWGADFASQQAALDNFIQVGGMVAGAFAADGGEIEAPTVDGSGVDDAAVIRVSDGEYVIPADVVRKKGTEFFDKLVEKYHTPAEAQRAQGAALPPPEPLGAATTAGFADGGAIEVPKQADSVNEPSAWEKLKAKLLEDAEDFDESAASGSSDIRPLGYDEFRDPYLIKQKFAVPIYESFMKGFTRTYSW